MVKYIPETKRSELPEQFSEQQINRLENETFYPGYFYNAVLGLKRSNLLLKDYDDGIINPENIRTRGRHMPFKKRGRGQKVMMQIKGKELKRIYQEGRTVGLFNSSMELTRS